MTSEGFDTRKGKFSDFLLSQQGREAELVATHSLAR